MLIEYKMSLSNLSNSFNLSLDGLSTIIADNIILNGVDLNNKITGDYIPYVGATKDINLNAKNLSNINVLDVSGICNIAGATTIGGVLSAGANKITSSAVPTANSDVINVLYANTNHYNKTYIDSLIALYYTKTQIDTTFTSYYTKSYIDSLIALYYTKSQIDTTLTNYYTKTQIDTTFTSYYTKSYIDSLIALYYTKSQIDTTFTNYYTKSQVDTTFTSYYTKSYIDSLIALYYTKSQVDSTFTSYYTKSYIDSLIALYYTKSQIDTNIYTKSQIDTNNYTKTATDTLLSLKATITYVDAQNSLKLNKAGGVMTGNLEILTATVPNLFISYNGYAFQPSVDTDIGIIRFYNERSQGNKYCEVKAIVRIGQYMPSIAFATKPAWPNDIVTRMVITENGNIGINTMNPTTLFYNNGNATIAGSLEMLANKITSSYVAVNDADLINKLYLTTNNYTKTQSDASLLLKLNKTGGTLTGPLDMVANKITSTYVAVYDADLINLIYLINNYYDKTKIDAKLDFYYTKTQIDASLALYYTKTEVDTTFTSYYTKTQVDTNIYTKSQSDLKFVTYLGPAADLNMNNKNILAINTISGNLLNIKSGNTAYATFNNAITLEYLGGGYKHAIKSRHNGGSDDYGNAIDFYVWKVADTVNTVGTKQIMSITSVGVGIFKNNPAYALDVVGTCYISGNTTIGGILNAGVNKITSTYIPVNNEDLINKLYLTTNNYTKTQTDSNTTTALSTFLGTVNTFTVGQIFNAGIISNGNIDAGNNRIIANIAPVYNNDCANKLYVDNQIATIPTYYYNKTQIDSQSALKLNKSGDIMTGNLEIVTGSIPNFWISYSGYAFQPLVDTDIGIIRFYNERNQGNKYCEVKAIVRTGTYMPSITFATKSDWSTAVTNRMIITEGGNVGINTTTPATLLDVNGATTLRSDVYLPSTPLVTTNTKMLMQNTTTNKIEYKTVGGGIFPIFSVPAEQLSNWGSGLIQNECFKTVKAYQTVMFTGHYGGYSTVGGYSQVNLRLYIYLTTDYITFPLKFYVNTTYSHYIVPINFCYQFSQAGSYSAHIYVVSNLMTDIADMVYLNATVLF
jgi:hypothetical protein